MKMAETVGFEPTRRLTPTLRLFLAVGRGLEPLCLSAPVFKTGELPIAHTYLSFRVTPAVSTCLCMAVWTK